MKTKEKILIKHYKKVLCDSNGTPSHLREDIYPAMEEYAEQEAKAYVKWLSNQVIAGRTFTKLFIDYKAQNKGKIK